MHETNILARIEGAGVPATRRSSAVSPLRSSIWMAPASSAPGHGLQLQPADPLRGLPLACS